MRVSRSSSTQCLTMTTFSISSTVDVSLFALAVVTVAVGALDDARCSLGTVPVAVVSIAAVGRCRIKVQRSQNEGEEEHVEGDTVHLDLVVFGLFLSDGYVDVRTL